MNKTKLFIFCTAINLLLNYRIAFSQIYGFIDDFETYQPGQQLACQNPIDWTTWDSIPCDPIQDPFVTSEYRLTGTRSVKNVPNNDLVKPVSTSGLGAYCITFWIYIPSGKSGYFNTLAVFDSANSNWGMECYLNPGGGGWIYGGSDDPTYFIWEENCWQFVKIIVYLFNDQAEFYFNNNLVHTWQWTAGASGGGSPLSIEANDFYGAASGNEMYIDNYAFMLMPLTIVPLMPPLNLTAEEIYETHFVELNWQDNQGFEYAYNILRKDGPPSGPGDFVSIGTSPANATTYIDSTVAVDSMYTYTVFGYNEVGISDTSNHASILVVVPVELVSFSYEKSLQNNIKLSWLTATETSNLGFAVERQVYSPQSTVGNWQKIGFVQGNGTTTEPKSYSFTDKNVSTGKYKFRLKQIDFDGSFEYSKEIEVEVSVPVEFSLSQNYPNPFNPTTTIRFNIPEDGFVSLKVFNVLGQQLTELVNGVVKSGSHEVTFSAEKLSSGVYYYKMESGENVSVKKMMVVK